MPSYSIIIPTIGRTSLGDVLFGIEANLKNFRPDQIKKEGTLLEVLIVFDGVSSQNFRKKITPLPPFRFEIKILETEKKVYAGGARNIGLEKAQGSVIIFLGDDTVPQENWLKKIIEFHETNLAEKKALLGSVVWSPNLSQNHFCQWLSHHGQFEFGKLNQSKTKPSWRHFYTANISFKKSLLEGVPKIRFDDRFSGWGFEDGEFGYRCQKKGLNLFYDSGCRVERNREQTPGQLLQRTKNARKNAKIFETIHPEIKILPRGAKLFLLRLALPIARFLGRFNVKFIWWYQWKKAWIGQ